MEQELFILTAVETMDDPNLTEADFGFRFGEVSERTGIYGVDVDLDGDGLTGPDKGSWNDWWITLQATERNARNTIDGAAIQFSSMVDRMVGDVLWVGEELFHFLGHPGAYDFEAGKKYMYRHAERSKIGMVQRREYNQFQNMLGNYEKNRAAYFYDVVNGAESVGIERMESIFDIKLATGILGPSGRAISLLERQPGVESIFPTITAQISGLAASALTLYGSKNPGLSLRVGTATTMAVMHALVASDTYASMYTIGPDGKLILNEKFRGMSYWQRFGYGQRHAAY